MNGTYRAPGTNRIAAVENYFNYFTEIEECFRRCRGTPTLLSPLDWALIESWKEVGRPLEAVLLGIERSFEKFKSRRRRFRMVNSLAYCSQEVDRAVEEWSTAQGEGKARSEAKAEAPSPFSTDEVLAYLRRNAGALDSASQRQQEAGQSILAQDLRVAAADLREIAARQPGQEAMSAEDMEHHLTALEEKLAASLTRASSLELLAEIRKEVERALVPYRRKMTGAQVESLERQFLKKRLYEYYRVPRLSLFYL